MLDVVTNHMGYNGCGDCVDYGKLQPFNNVCGLAFVLGTDANEQLEVLLS